MKEVFISYSTVDLTQAETVRNVLEKNGLSCWMAPRDIPGGSNYTKEIPIAIRNCKVFVLILSKNAQGSPWVLKELDAAVNNGKVILPFMLEDCTLNDEFNFLLTGAQRYSAYQKKAEAMETLIGRIRGILDAPSAVKEEAPQDVPEAAPVETPKVVEKKPATKPAAKAVADYFGDAKCTACGSEDLKELKSKVKYSTVGEWLTLLLCPVLAIIIELVGSILAGFLLPFDIYYDFMGLLSVLFFVLGIVWGVFISRGIVKRSRLRHGFATTCYRCNRCKKVFNYTQPLDN